MTDREKMEAIAITDEQLMESFALSQDEKAFDQLMSRHKARAYRFCLAILHDHDEAMDASQEGFIRVFRAAGTYQAGRPFKPWFHRILRNCALGRIRKAKRRRKSGGVDELVRTAAPPDYDPHKCAEAMRLIEAMSELSENHQEILALRHAEGLSYAEIAQRLGIPQGTVMSRLYHAREALRKKHGL